MSGVRIPRPLHRWNLSPAAAIRLQQRLVRCVRVEPLTGEVRLVAGADMAFSPEGRRCVAAVVVYDLRHDAVVEEAVAWRQARFPYVPGLLSFREAPAVLAAVRKLRTAPDVFLFDAQGLAHPRRFGLATHAGVLMDLPSVGCAKSRLCGTHDEPPSRPGGHVPLMDHGQCIGAVLRTRQGVRPVYVSVGHRVTLADAIDVVMRCLRGFRLPEPARRAHALAERRRTDPPRDPRP